MERRRLGSTGLQVTPLCLGAMNFGDPTDAEHSVEIIDAALDAGLDMIDVADVYAGGVSEQIVGAAFAANGRRDEVVLATKVGWPSRGDRPPDFWHRREHIVASCERSLASLQTDRIDLYQLHRPTYGDVPQEETLAALDELVRAGKVRFVGCSTHPAWMVMEALALAERDGLPRYATEQPPYNLLDRRIENELLPLCRKHDLGVLPWSPLGGGILAGRYADGIPGDSRGDASSTGHGPGHGPGPRGRGRTRRPRRRAGHDGVAARPAVVQGPARHHGAHRRAAHARPAHPGARDPRAIPRSRGRGRVRRARCRRATPSPTSTTPQSGSRRSRRAEGSPPDPDQSGVIHDERSRSTRRAASSTSSR